MRRIMPHTLQTKFLAGQGLVMALMVGFFALALNMHLERLMEAEAREKAALILSQVEAVQGYVRATLRPAMYRLLPEDQFVLEAMSTSYITRGVLSDQNLAREAFNYRRVGVGARNPDYEADERERAYIARFEAEPALVRMEEFVEIGGEQHFVTARPQRFETSCLRCHGDPAEAPRELLDRYGSSRGFGREVGQLAGIDLVRLKVQRDVGGIRDATFSFALLFAVGILLLFLVIQGFFHRLVVQSLRRVTGVMRRLFPEEAQEAAALPTGEDEIEDILHGFEAFAQHLRLARQDLSDYAATLEDKVAARTGAITRLADDRRADVALFVALLNSLNESQNKHQMLAAALALTAKRFGATRAGYACVLGASDYASWPVPGVTPDLPEDWHDLVAAGEPRLTPRAWYIPVQTSGTSRGLLCLFWDSRQEKSVRLADLARAIGQQLGIAMENLDALDGLLRQNDLLSSIFEGIDDPLLLLDTGGAVLLANSPARELAAQLSGASAVPGGHGFDGLREHLERATRGGGNGEFELALPEGNRIFEASLYPIPQAGGDVRNVASLREVTSERRMEGQMRRNERIVAVGQLAAGLAHEINNPLGVIRCYAELLQASQQEDQAQADLEVIVRHTDQARRVVRDLLDFARPRPAEPGPSNLAAVAASTLEVLRPRGKNNMTELSLEAAPDLPQVAAGSQALEHILTNLVMNALDAVAAKTEGGTVRVRLRQDSAQPGQVELAVADNGPGIAPEHLDRVFDPFFTTKEVGKGTGLGLAVVYSLVRDLGGSIEVENNPGGGALFRVHFPVALPADSSTDPAGQAKD
jgi:signal transduction histidine kinase